MKMEKEILFIIGAVTLAIFAGITVFSLLESKNETKGQVASYQTSDSSRPKVTASAFFSDLGNMTVSEEKTAEFIIKNEGDKPLQLFNISSSCDCTFGQVIINDAKSPEFSMHAKSGWRGEIKSGEQAKLLVIYRPKIMPVKGVVTRDVYVATNDPTSPKLTFTVKAVVE